MVHASQRPVNRHIHSRDGRLIEQNCGDARTQNGVIGITDVQAHEVSVLIDLGVR
jgi:hypothetical protein